MFFEHPEFPTRPPRCDGFQDDIAVLAIGALDGSEQSELLSHLDSCAYCAALYQQLSEVVRTLKALIPRNRFVRSHESHHGFGPEIRPDAPHLRSEAG
jgi:hypothetical protein